uniref:Uncharacterized protein n=1 Tax=Dunaliella tertiolecta TaxID=3047 RepID=A0A7S3R531_DUNTE|mmetsp:Transcript_5485/g.14821  ORF Transcript_5485/g.14821 Transcript_5485/m.14821 type:complete len:133 (+) Transcript_5485:398-796(+)
MSSAETQHKRHTSLAPVVRMHHNSIPQALHQHKFSRNSAQSLHGPCTSCACAQASQQHPASVAQARAQQKLSTSIMKHCTSSPGRQADTRTDTHVLGWPPTVTNSLQPFVRNKAYADMHALLGGLNQPRDSI